jgi:hypothetical protein
VVVIEGQEAVGKGFVVRATVRTTMVWVCYSAVRMADM